LSTHWSRPSLDYSCDRVGIEHRHCDRPSLSGQSPEALTGYTHTFIGLLACRALLGVAEAAGVPGYGKANAMYLAPRDWRRHRMNQVGFSLGLAAAPKVMRDRQLGWRSAFVVCESSVCFGCRCGSHVESDSARSPAAGRRARPHRDLLPRSTLVGIGVRHHLHSCPLYTLWTNWTSVLREAVALDEAEANSRFGSGFPPISPTVGGFAGGLDGFHWIKGDST